jgi:hypothetical protein
MTVYLLRRVFQSLLVLVAMSLIVFVGVYAVGDPVEILISPDATSSSVSVRSRRSASTCRCGSNTRSSWAGRCRATSAVPSSTTSRP